MVVSRVAVSSGDVLSQVGWMVEVAGDVLVRAAAGLRMKEVVWGLREERLGWNVERLVVEVETTT